MPAAYAPGGAIWWSGDLISLIVMCESSSPFGMRASRWS
jgi:hypothetical protein